MRTPRPVCLLVGPALAAVAVLAGACSDDDTGASGGTRISVTGTNTGCELGATEAPAGKITLDFTNRADSVSEVYVLTSDGGTVGEVENVTTGMTRTLTVDVAAGDYKVRCRPGQTGEGFVEPLVVTGAGGRSLAAAREVEVVATDYRFEIDTGSIATGDTIKFEMRNSGTVEHEFEVLKPNGDALGEIGPTGPGADGSVVLTFDQAGDYVFVCGLEDHKDRGMTGSFTVAGS